MSRIVFLASFLTLLNSYAGPSVTGGFGKGERLVECENRADDYFLIETTPIENVYQGGIIYESGNIIVLSCENDGPNWTCFDSHQTKDEYNIRLTHKKRNSYSFKLTRTTDEFPDVERMKCKKLR